MYHSFMLEITSDIKAAIQRFIDSIFIMVILWLLSYTDCMMQTVYEIIELIMILFREIQRLSFGKQSVHRTMY